MADNRLSKQELELDVAKPIVGWVEEMNAWSSGRRRLEEKLWMDWKDGDWISEEVSNMCRLRTNFVRKFFIRTKNKQLHSLQTAR